MAEKMKGFQLVKFYFEKPDKFAPNGGQPVKVAEMKQLTADARHELAELASKETGIEIEASAS